MVGLGVKLKGWKCKSADVVLGVFITPKVLHVVLDAEERYTKIWDIENIVKLDGESMYLELDSASAFYVAPMLPIAKFGKGSGRFISGDTGEEREKVTHMLCSAAVDDEVDGRSGICGGERWTTNGVMGR